MTDNVVVAFAGGVVSKEQQSAFNIFADEIAEAINKAKADKVQQGLIVAVPHWQDAPRTHEFVLDTLVCHDFGEPKGQCAICGGYCNKL